MARVTVRTDARMDADMETLVAHGWTVADAVRMALSVLADAHREGVRHGVVDAGERVDVVACTVQAPAGEEAEAA